MATDNKQKAKSEAEIVEVSDVQQDDLSDLESQLWAKSTPPTVMTKPAESGTSSNNLMRSSKAINYDDMAALCSGQIGPTPREYKLMSKKLTAKCKAKAHPNEDAKKEKTRKKKRKKAKVETAHKVSRRLRAKTAPSKVDEVPKAPKKTKADVDKVLKAPKKTEADLDKVPKAPKTIPKDDKVPKAPTVDAPKKKKPRGDRFDLDSMPVDAEDVFFLDEFVKPSTVDPRVTGLAVYNFHYSHLRQKMLKAGGKTATQCSLIARDYGRRAINAFKRAIVDLRLSGVSGSVSGGSDLD